MKVRALKVIRSSHLSNDIVKPGDIGEVLLTSLELSGRKLLKIRWENGMEGVALPSDVEFMEVGEPPLSPAATVSLLPSRGEAASSSSGTVHPKLHGDRPGQELVGSLPHFVSFFGMTFSEFDMGGEG